MDFDNRCVICKVSEDAAVNMYTKQLKVNSTVHCLHKFCTECLNRLYQLERKKHFDCPACVKVTKVYEKDLKHQSRDEIEVTNDAKVRKRIKKIYNKSESDFASLREFQDYEEQVEDMIYNLAHGIDSEVIEARLQAYQEENSHSIMMNNENRQREEDVERKRLERQEHDLEKLIAKGVEEDARTRALKKENKQQRNDVMLGERDRITVQDPTAGAGFSRFMTNPFQTDAPAPPAPVFKAETNQLLRFLSQRPEPKPMIKVYFIDKAPNFAYHHTTNNNRAHR
jgi:hypothetical protein